MFVWGDEILACRAQIGHSASGWLGQRMTPQGMGWDAVTDDRLHRFLYHGTKRNQGAKIARTGLRTGRMHAYTGAAHPWDLVARRHADHNSAIPYGDRNKDAEIVIISVRDALQAGCGIWQTKTKALLIDSHVPAQAIVAVEQRAERRGERPVRIVTKPLSPGFSPGRSQG
jgi:RNA:NAD 2'-phosphotransferase (TPT1/KptA family)